MGIREYFMLVNLGFKRKRSASAYHEFQTYQAQLLYGYLLDKGINVIGKVGIDVGSGLGGYSTFFRSIGVRIISLDLINPRTTTKQGFYVVGNGKDLPFQNASQDFIFCASVIEHVNDPARILSEFYRVLKPGAIAYISFPPYYSFRGGHRYSPFHYFGKQMAVKIKGRTSEPKWIKMIYPSHTDEVGRETWDLNQMTIAKFNTLLSHTNFKGFNISTRYFPVSLIRWPIIGEILTWHAQYLLRKPDK
jgi:SAM-dependent methyltransferase